MLLNQGARAIQHLQNLAFPNLSHPVRSITMRYIKKSEPSGSLNYYALYIEIPASGGIVPMAVRFA